MVKRFEELNVQRERMIMEGFDEERVSAMDTLIADYEPLIADLKSDTASETTIEEVNDLIVKDAVLARMVLEDPGQNVALTSETDMRTTSFASQEFEGDGIKARSLSLDFNKANSFVKPVLPESSPQGLESESDLKKAMAALDF